MDLRGKKLELTSAPVKPLRRGATVTAILKVKQPDYVPQGVQVRARADAMVFTAAFRTELLAQLETDPAVVSISLPKRLRIIK